MRKKVLKVLGLVAVLISSFYAGVKYEELKESKVCEVGFKEVLQEVEGVPQDVVYIEGYAMRMRKDGRIEIWRIEK